MNFSKISGWFWVGIAGLFLVILIKHSVTLTGSIWSMLPIFGDIAVELFRDLCFAIVVFAIVSYYLETKHMTDVFVARLIEVVNGTDYIKGLDDNKLDNIISCAEKKRYFEKVTITKDSLYSAFKKEIIKYSEGLYFEQYTLNVVAKKITDEHGNVFMCENATKTMKIVNPTEEDLKFRLPIGLDFNCCGASSDSSKEYSEDIQSVVFDGKIIIENQLIQGELLSKPRVQKNGGYNVSVRLEEKEQFLTIPPGPHVLDICVETTSPGFDREYITTLKYPCRNYNVSYHFDSNEHEVIGHGFLSSAQSDLKHSKKPVPNGMNITQSSWVIPGGGCYFYIKNKEVLSDNGDNKKCCERHGE